MNQRLMITIIVSDGTYEDYMLYSQWFIADTTIYNTKAFEALDYSFSDCGTQKGILYLG